MAKLIIQRANEYQNKLRKIGIYINNIKKVEIKNGESISLELPNGICKIKAKIDWCTSNELTINLNENEIHKVNLSSGFKSGIFMGLIALYYITFARNKYLKLVEE